MTSRQVYEYVLIELGKINAPALKLYEFNYLFNKAINQYINTIYTKVYDANQQATDDLRVLKSTAYLTPVKFTPNSSQVATSSLSSAHSSIASLYGATYEVHMPLDYLHLLNCICVYKVNKTKDCYDAGSYILIPAKRLTADSWAEVVSDMYNRPSPMNPYYYIHNQSNTTATYSSVLPQNPISSVDATGIANGIDMTGTYNVTTNGTAVQANGTMLVNKYSVAYKTNVTASSIPSGTTAPTITSGSTTYVYLGTNGNYYTSANNAVSLSGTVYSSSVIATYFNLTLTGADAVATTNSTTTMQYPDPDNTVATTANNSGSNFPRTLTLDFDGDGAPETNVSLVEKPIALRAGNPSTVRMEIRYGKDTSVFELVEVQVDYVKTPQNIRLTQEQIDLTEDTSQIMEFPDYVCQEIINSLVTILMLRNNDPKIQSKYGIDQQLQQAVLLNQPAMAQTQLQA